jgi:hypothetical protein
MADIYTSLFSYLSNHPEFAGIPIYAGSIPQSTPTPAFIQCRGFDPCGYQS